MNETTTPADQALVALATYPALARNVVAIAYETTPDPLHLMPAAEFTLAELQAFHEAVIGHALHREAFQKRMAKHLNWTGRLTEGRTGKPARIFTR